MNWHISEWNKMFSEKLYKVGIILPIENQLDCKKRMLHTDMDGEKYTKKRWERGKGQSMLLNTFGWKVVFTAALAMNAKMKSHHINTLTKGTKTENNEDVFVIFNKQIMNKKLAFYIFWKNGSGASTCWSCCQDAMGFLAHSCVVSSVFWVVALGHCKDVDYYQKISRIFCHPFFNNNSDARLGKRH